MPYLHGERVPDLPRAMGTLTGMRAGTLRAPVLYRAAMEGTSLNLAVGFAHMQTLGLSCSELRVVGGAAHNPLWCSILADCLGTPVRRLEELESAAFGAALQAMWIARRQAGDEVSLGDFVRPCVRIHGETAVPGRDHGLYQERLVEFRRCLKQLHDVG